VTIYHSQYVENIVDITPKIVSGVGNCAIVVDLELCPGLHIALLYALHYSHAAESS